MNYNYFHKFTKKVDMELIELKHEIIKYCENIKYPESYEEHIKFKKLFDYEWSEKIKHYNIIDTITYKKPFEITFENKNLRFVEEYNLNQRYVLRKTNGYVYNSDIVSFNFQIILKNDLLEIIKTIDEGDILKIEITGFIKSVESLNLNNQQQCSHNSVNILIEIFEFKLIEKKVFNLDIENLKLELKNQNKSENQKGNEIYVDFKSFESILSFLYELNELRYKSKSSISGGNSFQNKVLNEKYLNDFNSKIGNINNLIGLQFKSICEVRDVNENSIYFLTYYKNKIFFLNEKNYNKELHKTTFFLKKNSSVEISFIIKEVSDVLNSLEIELLTIKKNNKVKLFGTFISLEIFYIGIYVFILIFNLILFSKTNFIGFIPLLIKLTLLILFGYIVNKLVVKSIYKN